MNLVPMEVFMPYYLFVNDKIVVNKIIKEKKYNEMKAYNEFLNSETYRMCSDISLSMWDISPYDIYDMWDYEKTNNKDPRELLEKLI